MAQNPVATLKKGLLEFSKKIKVHKDNLLIDKLAKDEILSDDDEHWLMNKSASVGRIPCCCTMQKLKQIFYAL